MLSRPSYGRAFYDRMLRLTIPLVIQNLLGAAVSSADIIMLNYVDQSAISAVSLACNYASILFMVYNGLGTGATLLCAQYYGKGDLQAVRATEGIALRFSLLISAAMALAAFAVPEALMLVFTNDAELIAIGAGYLKILSVAYLCQGVTEVYTSVLRSIGRVTVCLVLYIVTFATNIFLNSVFIFGLFGAPKLGAPGVALATTLSRFLQLIGCCVISLCSKDVKLRLSYMFLRSRVLFKDFIKLALPALGNDVVWGLGFSMYSVILGHLGNDAVAANSLVAVVRQLGSVFCYGIATAGGVLVGNVLGAGDLAKAKKYGSGVLWLTVLSGFAGGGFVLLLSPLVLRFAALSDMAMYYLKYMLLINSYYIMGSAVNSTLIAGLFRAGGDTRFGLVCDLIDMWCYAVPLGMIAAFVLKLPVLWVYFLLCTDEFVKWPWVIRRYRKGTWIKRITRDDLFDP